MELTTEDEVLIAAVVERVEAVEVVVVTQVVEALDQNVTAQLQTRIQCHDNLVGVAGGGAVKEEWMGRMKVRN